MKFKPFLSYQSELESVLQKRRAESQRMNVKRKPIKSQKTGDTLELFVYGVIGESFWDAGVSALDVNEEIAGFQGSEISVRINSPGGDVFDGIAMFNALQSHSANVTTIVEGQAMSAASLVLQAGDTRIAEAATTTMIHRAWTMSMGNANDMREVADILEGIDEQLADLYAATGSVSAEEALALMDQETFMSPQQALDGGFVDQIGQEKPVENRSPYTLLRAKLALTSV